MKSDLPVEAKALLDAIAVGESGSSPDYTIIFGGSHFTAPPWMHPNKGIPIPGSDQVSTAAGRYQFIHSTWESVAEKAGLADFSPDNQDAGAWWLSQDDFKRHTGADLLAALKAGSLAYVAENLKATWTSLTAAKLPGRYAAALAALGAPVPAPAPVPTPAPSPAPTPAPALPDAFDAAIAVIDQRIALLQETRSAILRGKAAM